MKKNGLLFSLFGIVLIGLLGCGTEKDVAGERLMILHVNDTHSYFAEDDGEYGVTRMASVIKQAREDVPHLLVMHAGDMLTGTVYCNLFEGEMNVELFNKMGFDYFTIGNHEFDFGLEKCLELRDKAEFTMLSANVVDITNGTNLFTPYAITNIAGADVVIIGLTVSDMGVLNPDLKKQIRILDEAETLSYLSDDLRLDDTNDMVICLTHIGLSVDKDLAESFPEVDYFIGGHSHTKKLKPSVVGDNWVVQAGAKGRYVGKLDFSVNNGEVSDRNYTLIELDSSIETDPEIDIYMAEKNTAVSNETGKVIADSSADVKREDWGDIITGMLVENYSASAAFVNTGGIRTDVDAGDITVADIYEVYPFDNNVYILTMNGELLTELIQNWKNGKTGGLYWAPEIELTDGVVSIGGEPVDLTSTYQVVTIDFLYEGGDDYEILKEADDVEMTSVRVRDLLIEWVENHPEWFDDNL